MSAPRLSDETRKSERLTVLFTADEMVRLRRLAAYYALATSVTVHDIVCRALREKEHDAPDDKALEVAETRQDEWRERWGL